MSRLFDLGGRVAVVTGASSGLGLEIARGFAEHGATVVALVRRPEIADLAWLPEGQRLAVDVLDEASVARAMDRVVADHGRLDVLVNSAGVGGRAPAVDYPDDMWQAVMETNVRGSFWASRAAARHMLAQGSGSIINLASIGGLAGYPGSVGYQVSKGAVVQLTRSLAMEWADRGVRVNALAPSQFETSMSREQWKKDDSVRTFFAARTPLGIGDARDIVGPAVFLAADASAMVTGHILAVDGGYLAQ
jgi:NAD(P)-dependent dehydrogenase (short-subunit alcohol dehydrogenase family)